jgi:hypothetical protein
MGTTRVSILLRPPLSDRLQNVTDVFSARFGAEIPLAVDADGDGVGFQVAIADDEHGGDFHLLGALIRTEPLRKGETAFGFGNWPGGLSGDGTVRRWLTASENEYVRRKMSSKSRRPKFVARSYLFV